MQRTITSGKVIEKTQYYVGEKKPRTKRTKGNSSVGKQDANLKDAIRRLARLLNCNMGNGDLLLTLHYDNEHIGDGTLADADKACKLFWDRLSRALKKQGLRLRGFWISSDLDGETGEVVRIHNHLVIGGEGIKLVWQEDGTLADALVGGRSLREIWGGGGLDIEPLREMDDYTPLAVYLLRQVRGTADAKKWHPSRGLKQPTIKEHIVTHARELRAPGGATVKEVGRYDELTGGHYIRYIRAPRPKRERKVGGHKERLLYEWAMTDEQRWGLE